MQYCYWMQSIVHQPLQVEHVIQFYTVTADMYCSLACSQNKGSYSLLFTAQGKLRLVIEDPTDQGHCQWEFGSLFTLLTGFTVAIS